MRNHIYTIGHSNRSIGEFIELLRAHGITGIVDVRTIPKSRHNPQFGETQLKNSLRKARIAYTHEPLLGGLRRPMKNSPNDGWRNASFRGYADYLLTDDFEKGLAKLIALAAKKTTKLSAPKIAIMCAEAVPWRCHRSLISDVLKKKGFAVFHITSKSAAKPHRYTPFLRVRRNKIIYPASALSK
jgi:uncharacterized protein (DUF488 family)